MEYIVFSLAVAPAPPPRHHAHTPEISDKDNICLKQKWGFKMTQSKPND